MAGTIGRDTVIGALRAALEPLPFVRALVEGGAAAWRRIDAWSDIDLNVFIEEGKFAETFRAVEDALASLSPIEQTFGEHGPSEEAGMEQKFYLSGAVAMPVQMPTQHGPTSSAILVTGSASAASGDFRLLALDDDAFALLPAKLQWRLAAYFRATDARTMSEGACSLTRSGWL